MYTYHYSRYYRLDLSLKGLHISMVIAGDGGTSHRKSAQQNTADFSRAHCVNSPASLAPESGSIRRLQGVHLPKDCRANPVSFSTAWRITVMVVYCCFDRQCDIAWILALCVRSHLCWRCVRPALLPSADLHDDGNARLASSLSDLVYSIEFWRWRILQNCPQLTPSRQFLFKFFFSLAVF